MSGSQGHVPNAAAPGVANRSRKGSTLLDVFAAQSSTAPKPPPRDEESGPARTAVAPPAPVAVPDAKGSEDATFDSLEVGPSMTVYGADSERVTRPSMLTLRFGRNPIERPSAVAEEERGAEDPQAKEAKAPKKYGTIDGVYLRCLLNIFGVILFLRLGFVVGSAGWALTLLIIACCIAVVTVTALSLSAIATNGQIGGGGAYFMISRSLGPAFGGTIGLLFSLANAVAVALYTVGFSETIVALMPFQVTANWDLRIIGVITLAGMMVIALIGVGWVVKTDMLLVVLLTVAILSFFGGSFRGLDGQLLDEGITGYSLDTFVSNTGPVWQGEALPLAVSSFFSILAIFFPSVTGIMAGANISGCGLCSRVCVCVFY